MNSLKYLALIPARYASTRFPGKPLASLGGKLIVQRVAEQVHKAGIPCAVATDDHRIYDALVNLNIPAVMTNTNHKSGTDRIKEAADILHTDVDVVINVQGDEPFIMPEQIHSLMDCFDDDNTQIATLVKPVNASAGYEAVADSNLVKVTFDDTCRALYFSRSVIPFVRGAEHELWTSRVKYYTHIGMYAYRRAALSQITSLPQSSLEIAESLEQLRWLQAGFNIKVAVSNHDTIGIDTPEDLRAAQTFLAEHRELFG